MILFNLKGRKIQLPIWIAWWNVILLSKIIFFSLYSTVVRDYYSTLLIVKHSKVPSIARHVYYDRELNWLCKGCPYAQKCKQMISTDRQISKMTEIVVPVTKRQYSSSIGSSNGKETIQ
jgi:hypothetical protein